LSKEKKYLNIKDWSAQDRPREKLLAQSRKALSDAELIAILIGSGSRNESAVDLSKRILASVNNNLVDLARLDVPNLTKFKGIGEAKAISIVAALELGRRRKGADKIIKSKITTSNDAYQALLPKLQDLNTEEFWVLMLNRQNEIIELKQISSGGVAGTVVDPKVIFKSAIQSLASSIILSHNHPSGNLKPSKADIAITNKLKSAGESLEIKVLDHLIISEQGYYSFADEGIM